VYSVIFALLLPTAATGSVMHAMMGSGATAIAASIKASIAHIHYFRSRQGKMNKIMFLAVKLMVI
jgi:hypothetical protein